MCVIEVVLNNPPFEKRLCSLGIWLWSSLFRFGRGVVDLEGSRLLLKSDRNFKTLSLILHLALLLNTEVHKSMQKDQTPSTSL